MATSSDSQHRTKDTESEKDISSTTINDQNRKRGGKRRINSAIFEDDYETSENDDNPPNVRHRRKVSFVSQMGSLLQLDDEDEHKSDIGMSSEFDRHERPLRRCKSAPLPPPDKYYEEEDQGMMIDVDELKRRKLHKKAHKMDRPSRRKGNLWFVRVLAFPLYTSWWWGKLRARWTMTSLTIYLCQVAATVLYVRQLPDDKDAVTEVEIKQSILLLFMVAAMVGHCAAGSSAVGNALRKMDSNNLDFNDLNSNDLDSTDLDSNDQDEDSDSSSDDDDNNDCAVEDFGADSERENDSNRKTENPSTLRQMQHESHLHCSVSDLSESSLEPQRKSKRPSILKTGASSPYNRRKGLKNPKFGHVRLSKESMDTGNSLLSAQEVSDAIYSKIELKPASTAYALMADISAIGIAMLPIIYRMSGQSVPLFCELSKQDWFSWLYGATFAQGLLCSESDQNMAARSSSPLLCYLLQNATTSMHYQTCPVNLSDALWKSFPNLLLPPNDIITINKSLLIKCFISISSALSSAYMLIIFFQFVVMAEDSFRRRYLYAKYFSKLTSARLAGKARLPHFRLNKVDHIRVWLDLRADPREARNNSSYKFGDAAASVLVICTFFAVGNLCLLVFTGEFSGGCTGWLSIAYAISLSFFMYRFESLADSTKKKYQTSKILYTEQLNLYMKIFSGSTNKEELAACNNMIKIVISLVKEMEGGNKKDKMKVLLFNPLVYNVFKITILSAFGSWTSDLFGFKIRYTKL